MKIRNLLVIACFGLLLVAPAALAETATVEVPAEVEAAPAETAPLLLDLPAAEEMQSGGCIQVIVWAKHPGTGECKQYSDPCSVPPGWDYYYTQEECEAAAS